MYDRRNNKKISSKFKDFYKKTVQSGKNGIEIVKEVLKNKFPKSSTLNDKNKEKLFEPLEYYEKIYMFFKSCFNKKNKSNGCSEIAAALKKQGDIGEMGEDFYTKAQEVFESGKSMKSIPNPAVPLVSNLDNNFIKAFCCLRFAGSQTKEENAKSAYQDFAKEIKNKEDKFCEVLENLGELMKNQNLEDLFEEVRKKLCN